MVSVNYTTVSAIKFDTLVLNAVSELVLPRSNLLRINDVLRRS